MKTLLSCSDRSAQGLQKDHETCASICREGHCRDGSEEEATRAAEAVAFGVRPAARKAHLTAVPLRFAQPERCRASQRHISCASRAKYGDGPQSSADGRRRKRRLQVEAKQTARWASATIAWLALLVSMHRLSRPPRRGLAAATAEKRRCSARQAHGSGCSCVRRGEQRHRAHCAEAAFALALGRSLAGRAEHSGRLQFQHPLRRFHYQPPGPPRRLHP